MFIAFGSNAKSLMAAKKVDLPFTDLKSFMEHSDYNAFVFRGGTVAKSIMVRII